MDLAYAYQNDDESYGYQNDLRLPNETLEIAIELNLEGDSVKELKSAIEEQGALQDESIPTTLMQMSLSRKSRASTRRLNISSLHRMPLKRKFETASKKTFPASMTPGTKTISPRTASCERISDRSGAFFLP